MGAGMIGAVTELVIGHITNAPTAPFAVVELGPLRPSSAGSLGSSEVRTLCPI